MTSFKESHSKSTILVCFVFVQNFLCVYFFLHFLNKSFCQKNKMRVNCSLDFFNLNMNGKIQQQKKLALVENLDF